MGCGAACGPRRLQKQSMTDRTCRDERLGVLGTSHSRQVNLSSVRSSLSSIRSSPVWIAKVGKVGRRGNRCPTQHRQRRDGLVRQSEVPLIG
jgi:hypothetical protein